MVPKSKVSLSGKVRIIGGRWRGSHLIVPEAEGLRPTGDRIRETLFNWLQPHLPDSICLDLFAGSGALGFEAASRGASQVIMLESSLVVAKKLEQEKTRLGADEVRIHCQDGILFLQMSTPGAVNIAFLDPPFGSGLMDEAIAILEERQWLADGALIYLETDRAAPRPVIPSHWEFLKQKVTGKVAYYLARRSH